MTRIPSFWMGFVCGGVGARVADGLIAGDGMRALSGLIAGALTLLVLWFAYTYRLERRS